MQILHISDTHGCLDPLSGSCAIIHSGDFLPNSPNFRELSLTKAQDCEYQRSWLQLNKEPLKRWIGDRVFLLCQGNHDFYNPIDEMVSWGINAIDLTNKTVEFGDKKFHGFPYIPYIIGEWNFELRNPEMSEKVNELITSWLKEPFDVLVPHCPPGNILDFDYTVNKHRGNGILMNALAYSTDAKLSHVLCGHVHPANGIVNIGGVVFSNAAIGQRLIEI